MRKLTAPTLNILLAVGFVLILSGFFLLVFTFADEEHLYSFFNLGVVFCGAAAIYCSLTMYKRAFLFFAGLYLFLVSSFYLLVASGILSVGWDRLWPCGVILSGVSLFFTCLFRHRRLLTAYLFPSVLLVFLGCVFLLFSLDIISVSFRTFFVRWWPFALILVGVFLIGLFLYQQTPDNHFPYEPEPDSIDDGVADE